MRHGRESANGYFGRIVSGKQRDLLRCPSLPRGLASCSHEIYEPVDPRWPNNNKKRFKNFRKSRDGQFVSLAQWKMGCGGHGILTFGSFNGHENFGKTILLLLAGPNCSERQSLIKNKIKPEKYSLCRSFLHTKNYAERSKNWRQNRGGCQTSFSPLDFCPGTSERDMGKEKRTALKPAGCTHLNPAKSPPWILGG